MLTSKAAHTECVMVKFHDGYYERTNAEIESWDEVSSMADEIENIGKLFGWGNDWKCAYRLVIDDHDYYYFAR